MMYMTNLIIAHDAIEVRQNTPTAIQRQIDMIKSHDIAQGLLSAEITSIIIAISIGAHVV